MKKEIESNTRVIKKIDGIKMVECRYEKKKMASK